MVNILGLPPNPKGSEPEAIEPIVIEEGPIYPDLKTLTNKQRLFLKVFCAVGTIARASIICKQTPRLHYFWHNEGSNREEYRKAFERADLETLALLEEEAFRRAVKGTARPIMYKGAQVGTELEFDTPLLVKLMESKGEKYTPKTNGKHAIAGVTLEELTRNVFENLKDD